MAEPTNRYPKPLFRPTFDTRFDRRSFGEPMNRLRAISIQENNEPLVDLRLACPYLILRPGCVPFLRETVAAMVLHAQELLPPGYTLVIGTALRTMPMQHKLREMFRGSTQKEHPEWTHATCERMLNRMIAPLDPRSPPPHTTGGALDVGVRGPNGRYVKFSTEDYDWASAHTYSHSLSPAHRDNRLMLIEAMEEAGLTNYLGEWWHWSYGDQGWALRVGSPVAFYGGIKLDNAEKHKIPKRKKK